MSFRDWDISGHASPLRRELERLASSLLSGRETGDEGVWAPPVDIYERRESLVLLVDLPGLKREDIEVQVESDTVTIQGERAPRGRADSIRVERPSGQFHRSFRIGVPIGTGEVRASYRDGVLEISLPKALPGPARVPIDADR